MGSGAALRGVLVTLAVAIEALRPCQDLGGEVRVVGAVWLMVEPPPAAWVRVQPFHPSAYVATDNLRKEPACPLSPPHTLTDALESQLPARPVWLSG